MARPSPTPRTSLCRGYPADSGLLSVTVWSSSGALSDALSTACFVLGLEDSLPLLEQFDSQALFITQERQIYLTSGLEDAFTLSSAAQCAHTDLPTLPYPRLLSGFVYSSLPPLYSIVRTKAIHYSNPVGNHIVNGQLPLGSCHAEELLMAFPEIQQQSKGQEHSLFRGGDVLLQEFQAQAGGLVGAGA